MSGHELKVRISGGRTIGVCSCTKWEMSAPGNREDYVRESYTLHLALPGTHPKAHTPKAGILTCGPAGRPSKAALAAEPDVIARLRLYAGAS